MSLGNCRPTVAIAITNYKTTSSFMRLLLNFSLEQTVDFIFTWFLHNLRQQKEIYNSKFCHSSLHPWSRIKSIKMTSVASGTQETCFIWTVTEYKFSSKQMSNSLFSLHHLFTCRVFKGNCLSARRTKNKIGQSFNSKWQRNSKAGNVFSSFTWTAATALWTCWRNQRNLCKTESLNLLFIVVSALSYPDLVDRHTCS